MNLDFYPKKSLRDSVNRYSKNHDHRVLIVGGGIAGLTAALSLSSFKIYATVLEKESFEKQEGAGLQLSPNATRILEYLGVLDLLRTKVSTPEALILRCAITLKELAHMNLKSLSIDRWKAPYLTVQRKNLHHALLTRAKQSAYIEVLSKQNITDVAKNSEHIVLHMNNQNGSQKKTGHFLIGADGIHSFVRNSMSQKYKAHFIQKIAWRTTLSGDHFLKHTLGNILDIQCVTVFLHPQFHLVVYPVSSENFFNLVAVTKSLHPSQTAYTVFDSITCSVAEPFKDFFQKTSCLWTPWPIYTIRPNPHWIFPKMALIGDAAYAMAPFAAQGAALAIEDAFTLAQTLCLESESFTPLKIWHKERLKRVSAVARRVKINSLVWNAKGVTALARNLYLSSFSGESLLADLDWLYGWKPVGFENLKKKESL